MLMSVCKFCKCSNLVSYCPISDLFGRGNLTLDKAQADPNIKFPLLNKSNI